MRATAPIIWAISSARTTMHAVGGATEREALRLRRVLHCGGVEEGPVPESSKAKKRVKQPASLAQALAAQRLTDARMAWLDRFTIDAATYDALAKQANE